MQVKLTNTIPKKDGYYLLKMNPTSGLHLVLVATEIDGTRFVQPDDPKHKTCMVLNAPHSTVFEESLWSETPIEIV